MLLIIKSIIIFITSYLLIFGITCIVTRAYKFYQNIYTRYKEQNKGIIKRPKKQKEIKKTWNEALGVWEID